MKNGVVRNLRVGKPLLLILHSSFFFFHSLIFTFHFSLTPYGCLVHVFDPSGLVYVPGTPLAELP